MVCFTADVGLNERERSCIKREIDFLVISRASSKRLKIGTVPYTAVDLGATVCLRRTTQIGPVETETA